jgi:hypothetical protein
MKPDMLNGAADWTEREQCLDNDSAALLSKVPDCFGYVLALFHQDGMQDRQRRPYKEQLLARRISVSTNLSQFIMSVSGPSTTPLLTAFDHRRSCYNLTNGSTIPDGELEQVIKDCLNVVPSAFNTQTTRLVLLVGEHHTRLWEIIGGALRDKIGAERYASGTESKIKSFAAAYGTILFADDPKAVEGLKMKGGDLYGPKVTCLAANPSDS